MVCGNDYVYVDCIRQPPPRDPAGLARVISDRHFGVGGDGLILICPSERADARMRMFNADGSEAEMCGNGVRCVAKYVHDHGIAVKPRLTIETGRGVLTLDLDIRQARSSASPWTWGRRSSTPTRFRPRCRGRASSITQYPAMIQEDPSLDHAASTRASPASRWAIRTRSSTATMSAKCRWRHFGRSVECASCFPRRINVHFVQVHSPDEVTMRTWERGSGVTLACGTGACAVAVAGVLTGRTGRKLLAHLPGGDLELNWSETDDHVYMTGPAVEVFSGEWQAER